MTTFSDGVFQQGGAITGDPFPFQSGRSIFVNPALGSDTNQGESPGEAVKTLQRALDLASPNQNDVVYFVVEPHEEESHFAEAALQSETLEWNKDGVHLIGINGQCLLRTGSRIAQDPNADDINALVQVSANNCCFANLFIHQGSVGNISTTPIALEVNGTNNFFVNCRISGMAWPSMDVAGGRSLVIRAHTNTLLQNTFRHCLIGFDEITREFADAEVTLSGINSSSGLTNTIFEDCYFLTNTARANFLFVEIATDSSILNYALFRNCVFNNAIHREATQMTSVFNVPATLTGLVLLNNPIVVGANKWNPTSSNRIQLLGMGVNAAGYGLAVDVDA